MRRSLGEGRAVAEAELRRAQVLAFFAWGYVPPGHAGDGRTFDAE